MPHLACWGDEAAIKYYLVSLIGAVGLVLQCYRTCKMTVSLIFGSMLFGIGWGLAGICPGPAIASLGFGVGKSFVFSCFMYYRNMLILFVVHQH